MRVAVVDMGTNSTRLLVADVVDGARARARAALDRDPARARRRHLGPARRPRRSRTSAPRSPTTSRSTRRLGAERVRAIATSAVRDAAQPRRCSWPSCASASPSTPRSSTARGGAAHLRRRLRRAPAGGEDDGRRHRRRLDRAGDRRRARGRLLRLAAGRDGPPHRAPHHPRPAARPPSSRSSPATSTG